MAFGNANVFHYSHRWVKSLSCASYDYLKMVVSELQHRLDELNVLKLRESMAGLPKNFAADNEDSLQRFNPFDGTEQEPVQTITFLDLHEKYGRILRNYFQNDDNQCNAQTNQEQQPKNITTQEGNWTAISNE